MPGGAREIAIWADGSVFIIGMDKVVNDYGTWKWNGTSWTKFIRGASKVAVAPDGTPWVVNASGNIYGWSGSAWAQTPGGAREISIGSSGSIFKIGMDQVVNDYGIWYWNGSWTKMNGVPQKLLPSQTELPGVVNAEGNIYKNI